MCAVVAIFRTNRGFHIAAAAQPLSPNPQPYITGTTPLGDHMGSIAGLDLARPDFADQNSPRRKDSPHMAWLTC